MSFLVVGRGVLNKEQLMEQLKQWGIINPLSVITEAEKGRTICGQFRILGLR